MRASEERAQPNPDDDSERAVATKSVRIRRPHIVFMYVLRSAGRTKVNVQCLCYACSHLRPGSSSRCIHNPLD